MSKKKIAEIKWEELTEEQKIALIQTIEILTATYQSVIEHMILGMNLFLEQFKKALGDTIIAEEKEERRKT